MNTHFIILAAGMGKRISGFTNSPKSLLELNGQSLLCHHLEKIKQTTFTSIKIIVGHQKEKIISHLEDHPLTPFIEFIDNDQYLNNGNAYSLYLGLKDLKSDDRIIIIDADTIYSEKIFLNFIKDLNQDSFLIGPCSSTDIESTKIYSKENYIKAIADKRIANQIEQQFLDFSGEAIGLIKLSAEGIKKLKFISEQMFQVPSQLKNNWEELFKIYIQFFNLYSCIIESKHWIEIDTYEDFQKAEEIFAENN